MSELKKGELIPEGVPEEISKINTEFEILFKTIDDIIKQGKKLDNSFKSMEKTQSNLSKSSKKVADNTNNLVDATKKVNVAQTKVVKTSSAYFKSLENLNKQKVKANKLTKQEEKLLNSAAGSYNKIQNELSKNIAAYAKLSEQQRKNKAIGGALIKNIKKQDAQLKKLDKTMGRSGRSAKQYGRALGGIKSLLGAAGITGGIALAISAFRSMIRKGSEFEKAMSQVKAVSGATNEEFKELEDNAKKLGETTEKTATEVAGLQIELAKLGLSPKEILESTEAILNLSTAAGSDLAQSAKVAASTMKGFGLEAEEMTRIADVMAKSFSSSALDMSKFETAMSSVAPVAKNANVSLEETTAQLSLLVDRGLEASTAGTSLRNMFLKLSEKGLTFNEAMQQIRGSLDQNATALDLFGTRGATTAIILANNEKEAKKLTEAYLDSAGAAKKMADIMRDNVSGDADKAKSALEGLSLQIFNGNNKSIRSAIQGFTTFVQILSGTRDKGEDLRKEFEKQSDELDNLNSTIPDLIAEYESLKDSTDPEDQERLRVVIGEIAELLPSAVTEVDAYGNALAINTEKTEAAIEAQKGLVAVLKGESISETIASINEEQVKLSLSTASTLSGIKEGANAWDALTGSMKLNNLELQQQAGNNKQAAKDIEEKILRLKAFGLTNEEILNSIIETTGQANGVSVNRTRVMLEELDKQKQAQVNQAEFIKSIQEKSIDELRQLVGSSTGFERQAATELLIQKEAVEQRKADIEAEGIRKRNEKALKEANKQAKKLKKFEDSFFKDTDKRADEDIKARISKVQFAADEQLRILKEQYVNGEKSAEQYGQAIVNLSEETAQKQIDILEVLFSSEQLTTDQRLKLEKDLNKARLELADIRIEKISDEEKAWEDFYEATDDLENKAEKKRIARVEAEFDATQDKIDRAFDLANTLLEISNNLAEKEINNTQSKANTEIEISDAAFDKKIENAEKGSAEEIRLIKEKEAASESIRNEADRKIKELQIEQAIREKNLASFNVAINTIVAVAKTFATLGWPAGILPAAALAAEGAAQVLAIQSRPLPQFYKGVTDFEGGLAWTGEKGPELIETPEGSFISSTPQIMDLPKHSNVHTAEDTKRMLSVGNIAPKDSNQIDLRSNLMDIKKAIQNQERVNVTIDKHGVTKIGKIGDRKTNYINSLQR